MFAFILMLFSFTVFGQNISGIVLDKKTNLPIKDVNLYLKKTNKGTSTNTKGEFRLKLESSIKQTDTIYFSFVGYLTKKITISEIRKKNYIVYLSQKIEQLKEVSISRKKELNPKIHFNKLLSLKTGIHSFGSLLIENKIYVIGGENSQIVNIGKKALNYALGYEDFLRRIRINPSYIKYSTNIQVYNIDSNSWEKSDIKFEKRAYNNVNYYNNKLYVLGGKRFSTNKIFEYLQDKIEVFDIKSQKIIIDNTNPHQAVNFASVTYNSNIIILGGSIKMKGNGKKLYTNKVHIYNIDSGYWYQLKDMLKAKEVNGVLIKNKIYLIGGYNNKPLKNIEVYNISTGTWKKDGELFYGIKKPALTTYQNIIYIFDDGKILTYNIDTKELNEYVIDLFLKSSRLHYYNNKLYLIGGFTEGDFEKNASSKLYSIDINEFKNTRINNSKEISEVQN